ncbi:transposase [Escherichia coli O145:H25 str. 07-3858]|nr:transposase [Escherichia coli O145:H25 str. 07-3858]
MNDISSDDIFLLKQRLAEQEALIHALQEKLSNREREIDHLQAQLDKLRRMNFGSRSEKVSRRIARKRTARAVLTGMCYSAGSAMRHGSSSLTRLTGQSAMTPSTWRR